MSPWLIAAIVVTGVYVALCVLAFSVGFIRGAARDITKQRAACSDCGGTKFYSGPEGGLSQNVECASCGARFNVSPFGVERVSAGLPNMDADDREQFLRDGGFV